MVVVTAWPNGHGERHPPCRLVWWPTSPPLTAKRLLVVSDFVHFNTGAARLGGQVRGALDAQALGPSASAPAFGLQIDWDVDPDAGAGASSWRPRVRSRGVLCNYARVLI